VCKPACNQSLV